MLKGGDCPGLLAVGRLVCPETRGHARLHPCHQQGWFALMTQSIGIEGYVSREISNDVKSSIGETRHDYSIRRNPWVSGGLLRLLKIVFCTYASIAARSSCALSVHIRHARLPTSKKSLVKPLRRNKKGSHPHTLTGRESERAVFLGTITSFTNSPSRFELKASPPELKARG